VLSLRDLAVRAAVAVGAPYIIDYMEEYIKNIEPSKLKELIDRNVTDLTTLLNPQDRETLRRLARKYKHVVKPYLDKITPEMVFRELYRVSPFHAGIIYGHPNGLKWLRDVLDNARRFVESV
jgi:hypothetical protein